MCVNCKGLEKRAAETTGLPLELVENVHAAIKAAMVEQIEKEKAETLAAIDQLPEPVKSALLARLEAMDGDADVSVSYFEIRPEDLA